MSSTESRFSSCARAPGRSVHTRREFCWHDDGFQVLYDHQERLAVLSSFNAHPSTRLHRSGEIFELKTELNSEKKEKKREAVKKVIASMTVGKDVRSVCWRIFIALNKRFLRIRSLERIITIERNR